MNAPYDGDRSRAAEDAFPQQPEQRPAAPDPYLQDTYARDPYQRQDPTTQDPVGEALYDRAAHPPYPLYEQPQYVGVDELVSHAAYDDQAEPDPYEHLFRDQPQPPVPPEPQQEPEPTAAPKAAGKAGSILKSSAVMAAGTLVSRLTGFVRNLVVTAAIGAATLADGYAVAITLPTMIYILVGGGAINAVFVPQLVRSMKNDEDGGLAYANRLLTLVICGMGAVVGLMVLGAPLLVRMMASKFAQDPAQFDVAVTLTRYCLPTIFFMGLHVVMGQILNARGRFGAMMWTPVLNNIVIIFTFA
ncbi:MAG: putative peptidoglycan lipid flippase, partial [Streptomyces sp.]|nr:putative peptidoglycan lipid flippase [Streptomyces sp.]